MVNPAERLKIGTERERVKAEIEFCAVLARAFDLSGKPRKQIAAELDNRLGRKVTEGMLNDFTRIGERERASATIPGGVDTRLVRGPWRQFTTTAPTDPCATVSS